MGSLQVSVYSVSTNVIQLSVFLGWIVFERRVQLVFVLDKGCQGFCYPGFIRIYDFWTNSSNFLPVLAHVEVVLG